MSYGLPRPISDQSKICLRRFNQIWDAVRSADDVDLKLPPSWISDEFERFRSWAGSIGAVYLPGRQDSSLDLRLVEAPMIAKQVVDFLESLARDLESGERSLKSAQIELLLIFSSLGNCIW